MKKEFIDLYGSIKIRTKLSPGYIDALSKEAYSLFNSKEAEDAVYKLFTAEQKEQDLVSGFLEKKFEGFLKKYMLVGGTSLEFLRGKVKVSDKTNTSILNDILGELTIEDGVITKIEKVKYPEPIG